MTAQTLYILSAQSKQSPATLLESTSLAAGDLIADLRSFPPLVHQVQADRSYRDITVELHSAPDYWAVTQQWLVEFTERTGLQERLSVGGHGIWWTLNALQFTPGLSDLGNSFAWIDLLRAVQAHGPRRVVLYGQNRALESLLPQFFPGVTVEQEEAAPAVVRRSARRLSSLPLRVVRVLLGLLYLLYAWLRRPHVWFLSSTTLLRSEKEGQRNVLRDVYLGEVDQALRSRGRRTAVVEHHGSNLSWEALRARGFFLPYDLLLLLAYLPLKLPLLNRWITRRWRARWSQLQPILGSSLQYQGYDLSPQVVPIARRACLHQAPLTAGLVQLWRWVLRLGRPRLLYINCSYAQSAVPLTIAARGLGIPTIEQQHGVVAANHKGYVVPAAVRAQVRVPWCDQMVVWGPFARRLLIEAGTYRAEQIAVCGFPRIDALRRQPPPRADTLARLQIPPDAPVVLYTSNMIIADLYPQILDSLGRVPTTAVHWIVKLHPREKTRARWEQAIAERRMPNVHVVEDDPDFYSLLAACDLHVSFVSTTLIEAAVLGKPNLGLSWASVPDPAGYARAGAYLPVAPQQLGETVRDILEHPGRRESLVQEQKGFAEDWCRHDGSSVERIVAFVERTLEPR
jgi:hypothetical protein